LLASGIGAPDVPIPIGVESEQLTAARVEALRRIERRDAHAANVAHASTIEHTIEQIDRLLDVGDVALSPAAANALIAERKRLTGERTQARIAIFSTSTAWYGGPDDHVRARDGEGLAETTWRVLLDRGATGYQIAQLAGADKDSALRKRMDRWRDALRAELLAWRHELRMTEAPWERTFELLEWARRALERLG
jgi:hypothetical protein